ncbi:MAG: ral substrate transporter [Caulobacteraceae bacterium]|nr:ral substrate transporter [Caulobacteraceae bacterium]
MAQSSVTAAGAAPVAAASADDHLRLMLFGGALLLLINLAAPMHGLIGIPVAFFLKNRLHLSANQLAVFNLWIGAPLFAGFLFGFLRDRWSPFGAGDRGHIVLFGLATVATYLTMAFARPSYGALLACLLLATVTFQMIASAASGLLTAIGQREAVAGSMSMVLGVASALPALAAFLLGGYVSGWLEGRAADSAARILFLGAAGLMGVIALLGALGPKGFFARGAVDKPIATARGDVMRLLRCWPVYPVMLIQLFWQFAPAQGIVLQYHITNALHATDAQWGMWNAIFYGSFVPVYLAYGFLCRRVRLRWLLWIGFTIAVAQMVPLLFIRSAVGALVAALPMGLLGGIGQAALVDLTIRAAPKGLQGTMIMLFTACFWISGRFGDVFGTWLYDRHGGFVTAVIATIVVYALILPLLLLVPARLTATSDGEAAPAPS